MLKDSNLRGSISKAWSRYCSKLVKLNTIKQDKILNNINEANVQFLKLFPSFSHLLLYRFNIPFYELRKPQSFFYSTDCDVLRKVRFVKVNKSQ